MRQHRQAVGCCRGCLRRQVGFRLRHFTVRHRLYLDLRPSVLASLSVWHEALCFHPHYRLQGREGIVTQVGRQMEGEGNCTSGADLPGSTATSVMQRFPVDLSFQACSVSKDKWRYPNRKGKISAVGKLRTKLRLWNFNFATTTSCLTPTQVLPLLLASDLHPSSVQPLPCFSRMIQAARSGKINTAASRPVPRETGREGGRHRPSCGPRFISRLQYRLAASPAFLSILPCLPVLAYLSLPACLTTCHSGCLFLREVPHSLSTYSFLLDSACISLSRHMNYYVSFLLTFSWSCLPAFLR